MLPVHVISKSYSPLPGLTIWMLPYRLAAWHEYWIRFDEYIQRTEGRSQPDWTYTQRVFILAMPMVTRIEVTGELPLWVKALQLCCPVDTDAIEAAWCSFKSVVTDAMLGALWDTFAATFEDDAPRVKPVLPSEKMQ